ncbi:MAG: carbohydrate-binding protein [Siphonobacter sp.]
MKKTLLHAFFVWGTLFSSVSFANGQTYQSLPGKIEAESYASMSGIATESCSDSDGGLNISNISDGDWMDYNVDVLKSGTYVITFRIAESYGNGLFEVRNASGTTLASLSVPQTGGWQFWKTIYAQITLPAGPQTLRIYASQGEWNLNWFELKQPQTFPARFEAEAFDAISSTIQQLTTSDTDGNLNLAYINDNDWLDFSVDVPSAGYYKFNFRVANSYANAVIQIQANDLVVGEVGFSPTGGWQSWTTVSSTVSLSAGVQVIRLFSKAGGWSLNWFSSEVGSNLPAGVITFSTAIEKTVGDNPFSLTATSTNSESPITYTSSDSGIVSVSNTTGTWMATPVAAGIATITASQAASASFSSATPVSVTLTVNAADTTIGTKIPITASRWYQLNNTTSDLDPLFDEITSVDVNTGYGKILSNFDAYYPLKDGEQMTIQGIKFYDGVGSLGDYPLTVSVITDDWQRVDIGTFTGEYSERWVGPNPDRVASFNVDTVVSNVRYIIINAWYQYPTEMEFYGTYTSPTTATTTAPHKSVKLKDMLGINMFEWNLEDGQTPQDINETKFALAKSFRGFRHYMDWEKLEANEGLYTFNPTHSGGWNYDVIYQRAKAAGIDVLGCLKTIPSWMMSTYPSDEQDSENVPVRYGKDFTDPNSYLEQAKVAFQYTARYGRNTNINPSLVTVNTAIRWTDDPANEVKIGLDLVKYIECDNERDKWWKGRKAYQTGREYAANMSAFYDGHKNTMGTGVGVKNADSSMVVVMGGLASDKTDYVRGMIDWCKQYRGYKADGSVDVCWDVINYHYYSGDESFSQSGSSTRGVAPEISQTAQKAQKFVQMAYEDLEDMPLWVTETGFDLNQSSPLKAIAIGNKSVEQTQADWNIRTALTFARSGIDKVFFYQMYEDTEDNPLQFGSMGFINPDYTRRPTADFFYQVANQFGEFSHEETLNSDPFVDRYSYNGISMYSLVIPDEVGRTATYSLNLDGATSAFVYSLVIGSDSMKVDTVQAVSGEVSLTVTETPIFIVPVTAAAARIAAENSSTNLSLATLALYPNPSEQILKVSLQNDVSDDVQISVYDAGKGILHHQSLFSKTSADFSEQMNISHLPKGVYMVEIKQGKERVIKKIVKH